MLDHWRFGYICVGFADLVVGVFSLRLRACNRLSMNYRWEARSGFLRLRGRRGCNNVHAAFDICEFEFPKATA